MDHPLSSGSTQPSSAYGVVTGGVTGGVTASVGVTGGGPAIWGVTGGGAASGGVTGGGTGCEAPPPKRPAKGLDHPLSSGSTHPSSAYAGVTGGVTCGVSASVGVTGGGLASGGMTSGGAASGGVTGGGTGCKALPPNRPAKGLDHPLSSGSTHPLTAYDPSEVL